MPKERRCVVGYIRVSASSRAIENKSEGSQREKIEAWCKLQGHVEPAIYSDGVASGSRQKNRPQLKRAIDQACRRGGVLVVYSLSRLARNTQDMLQLAARLQKSGADLVSLTEQIDTSSASGRMIFKVLTVLAEFERDLIAERTRDVMQSMRRSGRRVGMIPYGHELSADGKTLKSVPAEQAAIARILQLRHAEHRTYRAIAQTLQDEGIASKAGGKWHPQVIKEIVQRAAQKPE